MDIAQEATLAQELKAAKYAELLAGRNYTEIAAALNAPTINENPNKAPYQVPVRLSLKMVMGNVPAAEMVKAYALPGYVADVKRAIDDQDREYLAVLLSIARAADAIGENTAAALAELLSATETITPPATIEAPSIAEALGIGLVTAGNVQLIAHRYFGG
jgi:hypothetical protein